MGEDKPITLSTRSGFLNDSGTDLGTYLLNDYDFVVNDDDGTLIQKIVAATGVVDNNAIFFIDMDSPL